MKVLVTGGVDPESVEVVAGDITDRVSVDAEKEMEATNLAGATNVLGAAVDAGCNPIIRSVKLVRPMDEPRQPAIGSHVVTKTTASP